MQSRQFVRDQECLEAWRFEKALRSSPNFSFFPQSPPDMSFPASLAAQHFLLEEERRAKELEKLLNTHIDELQRHTEFTLNKYTELKQNRRIWAFKLFLFVSPIPRKKALAKYLQSWLMKLRNFVLFSWVNHFCKAARK